MAETAPIIRFAKGSAVWCQTTPVNYHDAVVLEDCVEGDAEAVVRYTTAARIMRVAVDKVIPIGDARPKRSTRAPVPAVSPARPAAPRRQRPEPAAAAPRRRLPLLDSLQALPPPRPGAPTSTPAAILHRPPAWRRRQPTPTVSDLSLIHI